MIGLFFQTRSFQLRPAALSSLRSSGRLTASIRFAPAVAHPYSLAVTPFRRYYTASEHRILANVIGNAWTTSQHQTDRQEIDNENSLKRHFMTIHFKETIKPINLKEC